MTEQGNPNPHRAANASHFKRPAATGPVFPGKGYLNQPYPSDNLAVQHSLMEIFDEFSQVISGELKSMNLDEFETEHKPSQNHP